MVGARVGFTGGRWHCDTLALRLLLLLLLLLLEELGVVLTGWSVKVGAPSDKVKDGRLLTFVCAPVRSRLVEGLKVVCFVHVVDCRHWYLRDKHMVGVECVVVHVPVAQRELYGTVAVAVAVIGLLLLLLLSSCYCGSDSSVDKPGMRSTGDAIDDAVTSPAIIAVLLVTTTAAGGPGSLYLRQGNIWTFM